MNRGLHRPTHHVPEDACAKPIPARSGHLAMNDARHGDHAKSNFENRLMKHSAKHFSPSEERGYREETDPMPENERADTPLLPILWLLIWLVSSALLFWKLDAATKGAGWL